MTYPLTVDFRDGFYNDTIAVVVDEVEVYRQENVTTRTMTGLAGSTEILLDAGKHMLRVNLSEKEVSNSISIDINSPLYLGLEYIPQKGLESKLQGEPFKYM